MSGTDLIQQINSACYMIAFSIAIMLGFAFTNEIGKQAKWNRYKYIVSDFVLVLLCGILFCVLLISKNYGLLRNYILLGLVVGFVLYRIFLRRLCKNICKHSAKLVLWCCKKIKWFLLAPWHLVNRYIVQRIKRKIIAACQRRAEKTHVDDELEEII